MLAACKELLPAAVYTAMQRDIEAARKAVQARTAWRIDGTLREFPKFPPVNLWFDYPVHHVDDIGCLQDVDAEGEAPPWQKATDKRKERAGKERRSKAQEFEDAIQTCTFGNAPTKKELAEYLGITERSVTDRLKAHGGYMIDRNNGNIIVRKANEE